MLISVKKAYSYYTNMFVFAVREVDTPRSDVTTL